MALKFLLGLSLLVASAVCQEVQPCCFPERWQAFIEQFITYTRLDAPTMGYREGYLEYAYDHPNRKIAGIVHNDYHTSYDRFVFDYNEHRAYFIKSDKCVYRGLSVDINFAMSCIPDSSFHHYDYGVGLDHQLTYQQWFISVAEDTRQMALDVSSDNCVPGYLINKHSTPFYSMKINQKYSNVSSTIKDEAIFDVPSNCSPETQKTLDGSDWEPFALQSYYSTMYVDKRD